MVCSSRESGITPEPNPFRALVTELFVFRSGFSSSRIAAQTTEFEVMYRKFTHITACAMFHGHYLLFTITVQHLKYRFPSNFSTLRLDGHGPLALVLDGLFGRRHHLKRKHEFSSPNI